MVRQLTVGFGITTLLLVRAPPVGQRDRPDRDAVGVIRAVQSAQTTHFSAVGYYETLQCLASATCLRQGGMSSSNGWLIDPQIASLKNRYDYRLLFFLGPRSTEPVKSPSATPLTGFAMVATGVKLLNGTIVSFCGDATRRIYATPGDRLPSVRDGRCLETAGIQY